MGKKNVHKLSFDPGESLVLLGISSHENDYRLSWSLNEYLGFHFVKADNLIVFNARLEQNQEFSVYNFNHEKFFYRLISNRCNNGFWVEELKNIDFFLLIEESDVPFPVNEFISQIRNIPFVATVFRINIDTIKNRNKLFIK